MSSMSTARSMQSTATSVLSSDTRRQFLDRPDVVAVPTTSAFNPMAAADDEAAVELAEFFSEYGDGGDSSPTPLVSYGSPAAEARSPVRVDDAEEASSVN